VERVKDGWDKVIDWTNATNPTNLNESLTMYGNFHEFSANFYRMVSNMQKNAEKKPQGKRRVGD
jgi:hypothetical protein